MKNYFDICKFINLEFPYKFQELIISDICEEIINKYEKENFSNYIDLRLINSFVNVVGNLLINIYNGSTCIDLSNYPDFLNYFFNNNYFKNLLSDFVTYVDEEQKSLDKITPFILKKLNYEGEKKFLFYRCGDYVNENEIKESIKKRVRRNKDNQIYINLQRDEKNINNIIDQIIENSFVLITGKPGSGKTTLASKIFNFYFIKYYNDHGRIPEIFICAPTGKGANVLSLRIWNLLDYRVRKILEENNIYNNSNFVSGTSIHKLLGFNSEKGSFNFNKDCKLKADLIIVDEASMIDLYLFSSLIQAISELTKLVILGDKDQLPSVDCGNVFGDIIESKNVFKVNLEGQFRFVDSIKNISEDILKFNDTKLKEKSNDLNFLFNSEKEKHLENIFKKIRFLPLKDINKGFTIEDFENGIYFLEAKNEAFIYKLIDFIVSNYSNNFNYSILNDNLLNDNLDRLNAVKDSVISKFALLVCTNRGFLGTENINDIFINYYKDNFELKPVIILENDYENNLFNGDTGLIVQIKKDGNLLNFFMSEDGRFININLIKKWNYSFCLTVHKSQGSSYDDVYFVLPTELNSPYLNKQIIYTAITRAKKRVFIFGKKEVFINGLEKSIIRESGLKFL
ncbi:MAG: AAA family ATPase [Spirochaetes bacterium]|nr:AAA family ATPase [Spirochaetota bacterium]